MPNPSEESGEFQVERHESLEEDLQRMFRRRLKRLVEVAEDSFSDDSTYAVSIPISTGLVAAAGPDKPAQRAALDAAVNAQLEKAGFAADKAPSLNTREIKGYHWQVPDEVLQPLAKGQTVTEDSLRDYVRKKGGEALELADVKAIKGGFIITGVPRGVKPDVLFDAESVKKVHIDYVVDVTIAEADAKPVLDGFLKEEAAQKKVAAEAAAAAAKVTQAAKTPSKPAAPATLKAPTPTVATAEDNGNLIPLAPTTDGNRTTQIIHSTPSILSARSTGGGGGLGAPRAASPHIQVANKVRELLGASATSRFVVGMIAGGGSYEITLPEADAKADALKKLGLGDDQIKLEEQPSAAQWLVPKAMMESQTPIVRAGAKPDFGTWVENKQAERDVKKALGNNVALRKLPTGDFIIDNVSTDKTPKDFFKAPQTTIAKSPDGKPVAIHVAEGLTLDAILEKITVVPTVKAKVLEKALQAALKISTDSPQPARV